PARPNILYVMGDDHCATAIGAYGSRLAKLNPTPVIDTLARDGMRFDNCFCVNSICTPSRANIITGQYSQANGVLTLGGHLPAEKQYLPKLMKEAGYSTAIVGKWHLSDEPQFDYYKVLPGQGVYFNPQFHETGQGRYPNNLVKTTGYVVDLTMDAALNWLQRRDKTQPFFLCVHFKAPHGPWSYPDRYASWLEDVEIPYPDSLFTQGNHGSIATRGDHDELIHYLGSSVGRRNVLRNQAGKTAKGANVSDEEALKMCYQDYLHRYLRCAKSNDDNLKRMLDYLAGEGVLDDTVICYTGDQGMWLGEHDYIDKRWMYEESMRMPFLVRYPRSVAARSRTDALVNNTDFAPTLLDFAGVATPDYMHGRSFRGILETGQEPADWRDATYYRYWMHLSSHYNPAHFGVRAKRYKLIFFYGVNYKGGGIPTPPGWEFYDLEKDPEEMNNAYGDPAYASVIADLKQKILALREKYGETDNNYPAIQAIIDKHWNTTDETRAEAVRISHEAKKQFEQLAAMRREKGKKPREPKAEAKD
ncbi:MAG: sulfatase, partial [Candidatus Sumerlaeota bacterium]|nr:sulfatase [Candidatus Sumerlaeota bacterium]